MFGISYGEIVVIMAAAFAMFGPKDIPLIARAAGRLSGKAIGYIQSARGSVDGVMQHGQVKEVHKEMRELMAQVDAIQHEMRSGISLVNPGPFTRRILNVDSSGARPVNSPTGPEAGERENVDLHSKLTMNTENGLGLGRGMEIAFQMHSLQHATIARGRTSNLDVVPPSTTRVAVPRMEVKPVAQPSLPEHIEDINVLPISALSAGLLPARTDPLQGGSDLVYETIVERKVAFDTLEFFKQAESFSKVGKKIPTTVI